MRAPHSYNFAISRSQPSARGFDPVLTDSSPASRSNRWLQVFPEAQLCPVCKAGLSEELVRPPPRAPRIQIKTFTLNLIFASDRIDDPIDHRLLTSSAPHLILPKQVIPLYGRGSCEHPRGKQMLGIDVPTRPQGLRLQARNPDANGGGEWGTAGAGPAENVGLVSTLLGFGIQFGASGRSSLLINSMSPEQQQQAFLSQLLLLLGSFVILCLLIF